MVTYATALAAAPSIGLATVVVIFVVAGSATCAAGVAGNSDMCFLEALEETNVTGVGSPVHSVACREGVETGSELWWWGSCLGGKAPLFSEPMLVAELEVVDNLGCSQFAAKFCVNKLFE